MGSDTQDPPSTGFWHARTSGKKKAEFRAKNSQSRDEL